MAGLYERFQMLDIPREKASLYVNAVEDLWEAGDDFSEALEPWLSTRPSSSKAIHKAAIQGLWDIHERLSLAIHFLQHGEMSAEQVRLVSKTVKRHGEVDIVSVNRIVSGEVVPLTNRAERILAVQGMTTNGIPETEQAVRLQVHKRQISSYKKYIRETLESEKISA